MLALKTIAILLGSAFTLFGYFIYFRKKYSLINDYEAERKAGRRDEEYAKRVGMTEFILGIAILLAGLVLIVFF